MSDNKTVILKTILDKTGLQKGFKEVQNWLKKNPLKMTANINVKSAEKQWNAFTDKINKQLQQCARISYTPSQDSAPLVTTTSGQASSHAETPDTKSGNNIDLSLLAGVGLEKLKQSLEELLSLSRTLDDIGTASNMTRKELQKLGDTAYETAGKYGKNTSDYLSSVREMADSGYENAGQMGELSTMLQSAKGFSSEMADTYITAADAAYNYGGNIEKLTSLLDGQNEITNKNAISMKEMAEAVQSASAEMPLDFTSISEDEMSALLGTGIEISGRTGEEVGKTVGNMLTSLKEDSDGLQDPIERLKELSEVYQSLPEGSPERLDILSDIGDGTGTDILSGILENWEVYEKMLADYDNSSGSVMNDAMAHADSLDGSLNQLESTWLDLLNNFAGSSELSAVVDMLNGLLETINKLTSVFNTSGLIGAGLGAFLGSKNIGKTKSCLLT